MGTGKLSFFAAAFALVAFSGTAALAGGHTWRVNEVFTNASGTVQFIELRECCNTAGETATSGHAVTATNPASSFTLTSNVASPTSNKHILLGTAAYDALPNSPTPNYIIPANFISTTLGNTITYNPYDSSFSYLAGVLPTNGVQSLNDGSPCGCPPTPNSTTEVVGTNSPTNYAVQTGSIDASVHPAAVPDGDGATVPMTVRRMDVTGSTLRIFWDTASCSPNGSFQVIYGEGSDLPASLGGTFGLLGSVCASVGPSTPYQWTSVPTAGDGSGLLWWLMTIRDTGNKEGSWGHDVTDAERVGPGPGGSSGECGVTAKDLTNVCGQ